MKIEGFEKVKKHVEEIGKSLKDTKSRIPVILGNMAVNHYKEGFRYGGRMTDASADGWKNRIYTAGPTDKQRAILVKQGHLMNDIKLLESTWEMIRVGTTSLTQNYATIHNRGGVIKITEAMRSHFWKMYYQALKKKNKKDANFWKAMALHKGTFIKIPKREFIGKSKFLSKKLAHEFIVQYEKSKKHKL